MSEQMLLQPIKTANSDKAKESLEKARIAHEKYLIRQQNTDLQDAIEYYIDAVKYDPTMPEAYYRLATLMWEQGQISLDTAIEQCKTAISLAPKNINAHLYTGFFMKMANDFKSAEKEFKSAIKMDTLNSARPRLILSQSILQKINSKNGNVGDYISFLYYFLSGSLMLAWDRPSMKMFYKNMSDDFSVFTYNTVGKFLEKFKLYPTAENIYKQAITSTSHGEIFYDRMGDLALKNKETELCVDCYKKVLEANPLNREVLVKLATVLQTYFPENTDETIDCYERYDEAIEHYQKAISINPDKEWTSIVCEALGTIYAQIKGNIEAAVSTYQAGIILDPNNYSLYLSLGDVHMANYDLDNAIRAYCDAIMINPEDYRAYSKAGIALWEKDYLEEALVSFHKAIDLNPENEYAQNNLGILYLDGLGDAEEALEYFETAIELNPNYTLAYFNAGRASQAMGFINDSANYYQMAIDLNKITQDLDEEDIVTRLHKLFDI